MNRFQVVSVYALVAFVFLTAATFALLTTQRSIQGMGSIKTVGLGVYWDLQCTNATSTLDFGLLEQGSSKNFTLFLKNEGNSVLALNMTSENWNPASITDHMTFTWNREGHQISPDEVIDFTVTLSVSENIENFNSFSFDIVISGEG